MALSTDEKYNLITRNLQEKIDDEIIVKKIISQRSLKLYFGTCPTGRIHIGYFIPLMKIVDLLQADCEVIILIADLHAVLDNLKSTFEQIELRTKYYTIMIQEILKSLNVDISKLKFVKGSDYQLSKEYNLDMYKANTLISVSEAKHSGAEVVKQTYNPKMTGLLYPTLQALDEQFLGVDGEISGIDQKKIFGHALNIMPKLGYKKRFYYMTSMVPGIRFVKNIINEIETKNKREQIIDLINTENNDNKLYEKINSLINDSNEINIEKMSSSNNQSKIDILDSKNQLKLKINKAYCLPGDIEDNSLLTLLDKIIFPILNLKKQFFKINRKLEYGGEIIYNNIDEVKKDFQEEKLYPADLKLGIIDNFDMILKPIRDYFQQKELQNLIIKAYPV